MDLKPVNPDKKAVKPLKALEETIKKAKKTDVDTKALKAAGQGLTVADKALEAAMEQAYLAFAQACRVKIAGEVCLDGETSDRMAFQARANYQNHALGWLQRGYIFLGGRKVVRFPRIWMSSGVGCHLGNVG